MRLTKRKNKKLVFHDRKCMILPAHVLNKIPEVDLIHGYLNIYDVELKHIKIPWRTYIQSFMNKGYACIFEYNGQRKLLMYV